MLAITGEENAAKIASPLPFSSSFTLSFEGWDRDRFPLLRLAYEALGKGSGYRIAYLAADEVAVGAFIDQRIPFTAIADTVEEVLSHDFSIDEPESYEEICEISYRAREIAEKLC